jgi:hypothetical protein
MAAACSAKMTRTRSARLAARRRLAWVRAASMGLVGKERVWTGPWMPKWMAVTLAMLD